MILRLEVLALAREMTPPPGGFGGRARSMQVVKPKNMKGTLLRLWQLTKGKREGVIWLLLLSVLTSSSAVLSPYIIGKTVNSIAYGNVNVRIILLLAGLYVSNWLVLFLQQFFMAAIGQKIIYHIRITLFDKMKELPLSFFDRHRHGELMSRLTNDVDNISTTISDSLSQLMTYVFTILGVLVIMFGLSPSLTFVSFVAVLLIFLLTKTVTTHTRKFFAAQQAALGSLNGQVEESISGLNMVKAFGQEEKLMNQFEENNQRLCEVATKAQIWSGYLMPMTNVINNLNYVMIAVISGIMAANGKIELGMISSFLLYSKQFARPFVDIANIYNNFQTAVAGAERVFQILDEECEPEDVPDALPLENPVGEIVFDHVIFGYQSDRPILKDVSVRLEAGTKVAVVGSTGAGKTTFINLLTRFYDVDSGRILLDGRDLRDYKMADLRKAFGVVLQDTALFGMSIRDNISYGREDVSLEQIKQAAKMAGADSFIRRLPQGYDTVLQQGGAQLSQGERQLLTIARAVLTNAPILILDEATSSVDTVTEQRIRKAMLEITKGRTSIIIAHRLSTIRDSDLILLMEDGQIAEMGNHEELMSLNGRYAKMYQTQSGL